MIRLAGTIVAVSDPPPGSSVVVLAGTKYAQSRDGWLDVSVDGRTLRVMLAKTPCSGQTDRTSGGWRDLEPTLLEPIETTCAPFTPVEVATVIPKVGDRVEVYGQALATSSGETGFRDAPEAAVTRMRALLVGRNASLDDAIAKAYPDAVRPEHRDQRPTAKSWLGVFGLLALAVVALAGWGSYAGAIAFCGAAVTVRPRLVRAFRSGTEEAPYSALAFLYDRLFGYMAAGSLVTVGSTFRSDRSVAWFVTGYFALGIWLAFANRSRLAPFRRLLAATPWSGGDADEVLIEGTVTDSTPVAGGAAIARIEEWDRGSGGEDASMIRADLANAGTYTILAQAGDVVVDPTETQWASSVVATRDHGEDKDRFALTESIPVGGNAAAVGSITKGKLRSKGTAPALVLATSRAKNPLALARSALQHDQKTAIAIAIVAVVELVLAVVL